MTKRLFSLAAFAAVLALAVVPSAFAQIVQEPRPLAAALTDAGIFNIPDPTPVCVTPPVNNSVSTTSPVGVPVPTPVPQVQQVALQAFCLQSNGLVTKFQVTMTNPFDAGVQLYIQNAGGGDRTDSFVLSIGKQLRPVSRFDRSGFVDNGGAQLFKLGTGPDVSANDFVFSGNTMTFSFANSDIGNEGRPAGIALYVYDRRDGQAKSVFPAAGYVPIPTTLSVNLPPSQTLYRMIGKPSRFQLVASVSSVMGPAAVSFLWLADGRDNITDMLNSQSVGGIFPLQAIPSNQPVMQEFTRRIDYDINNLHPGTRLRVTVLSPVGIAFDEVVYGVQETLEPPSLPIPR